MVRCVIRKSARTLCWVFRSSPHFLQVNSWIVPHVTSLPLPSASFTILRVFLGEGGKSSQQTLRTHRSLKAYCATLWWRWRERWLDFFFIFRSNWAPVEWNCQGKPEVIGGNPVPVPLCPPQIPHGLMRDRTRVGRPATNRLSHGTARFFVH
jgi:hypothetical protein